MQRASWWITEPGCGTCAHNISSYHLRQEARFLFALWHGSSIRGRSHKPVLSRVLVRKLFTAWTRPDIIWSVQRFPFYNVTWTGREGMWTNTTAVTHSDLKESRVVCFSTVSRAVPPHTPLASSFCHLGTANGPSELHQLMMFVLAW